MFIPSNFRHVNAYKRHHYMIFNNQMHQIKTTNMRYLERIPTSSRGRIVARSRFLDRFASPCWSRPSFSSVNVVHRSPMHTETLALPERATSDGANSVVGRQKELRTWSHRHPPPRHSQEATYESPKLKHGRAGPYQPRGVYHQKQNQWLVRAPA